MAKPNPRKRATKQSTSKLQVGAKSRPAQKKKRPPAAAKGSKARESSADTRASEAARAADVAAGKINELMKGVIDIVPGWKAMIEHAQSEGTAGLEDFNPEPITEEQAMAINDLAASLFPQTQSLPPAITLQPCKQKQPALEPVAKVCTEVQSLGFAPIDTYELELIPGFRLHAYWNPVHKVFAVVYDTGLGEPTIDIQRFFSDSRALLVTSSPGADLPDDSIGLERKIRLPGATPAQLMRRMRDELSKPGTPQARDTGPNDFVSLFEESYSASLFGMQMTELGTPKRRARKK